MKLLYCSSCGDIFNLTKTTKACSCGAVSGKYKDNLTAEYTGRGAIPIGFANSTFIDAVRCQPLRGAGKEFVAFVIPTICPTFILTEK
jgi:hypothetical protein